MRDGRLRVNGRDRRDPGGGVRLGGEFVLRSRCDEIRELELHLVEQAGPSLAAPAIELAAHLRDGKPQMRDHRLGAGLPSPGLNEVRLRLSQFHLARQNEALERLDVVRQGVGWGHAPRRADSSPRIARHRELSQPAAPGRQVRCG